MSFCWPLVQLVAACSAGAPGTHGLRRIRCPSPGPSAFRHRRWPTLSPLARAWGICCDNAGRRWPDRPLRV